MDALLRLRKTSAENIEYYQCQEELNNELLLRFKELERVIGEVLWIIGCLSFFSLSVPAARRSEDGSGQEYLCKWEGLPYSECTWEDSALIADKFMNQIDLYNERNQSDCIPNKNAKVSLTIIVDKFAGHCSYHRCYAIDPSSSTRKNSHCSWHKIPIYS